LELCLGDERQATYKKILEVMTNITDVEVQHRLLNFSIEIFGKNSQDNARLKLRPVEIRSLVSNLLKSDKTEYQKTAREFLLHFIDRE